MQLAKTYRQLGEYDAAQQQIDRVRELQASSGFTSPSAAQVLLEAGSLAWNRSEIKEAEKIFRQALDDMAHTAARDSLAEAELSLYLGNVLQEQGAYGEADTLMHRSLAIYRRQPKETDGLAVNLNSLGNLARYKGDLPAADAFYQ